jgi:ribosomal protein S18 acetylase RimI-like enzyme
MTTKAGAGADVRVIGLASDRLAEAADVLARSFHDNPNFVALFPDEKIRTRVLAHVFGAGLRDALGFEHVYAAMRGEEIVGVAAWLPPGAFPLSPWRQLRAVPDMARILAAAPRSIPRLVRFVAGVNKLHPEQPYWYLEVVGVDPDARGLGIGTRLLEPVLSLADEAGQPCYLETMTERDVAWYRGLGFEVRSAGVSFIPGGPPNWTMFRPPRQR